jgi:hypothetical protein
MDNFNTMSGYQPAPQQGPARGQFPPYSNIILVDSLEQALQMPTRVHSEMVYWNRYQDEIYRIYTDYTGGKQYMILEVKIKQNPKEEKKQDATDILMEQIKQIQANLEVLNEKYNVNADGSDATERSANVSTK